MTTEQQIHQALIKNNFLKDKDKELGFAWIADAMALQYTALQSELIGLHAKYHGSNEMLEIEQAAHLWGRLTGKTPSVGHFSEMRNRAIAKGFKFAASERKKGAGRKKALYNQLAVYRLAQHTLKWKTHLKDPLTQWIYR